MRLSGVGIGLATCPLLISSTCIPKQMMELYLNVDSSSSFASYIPKAQSAVPAFLYKIQETMPGLKAGLAYFGDDAPEGYNDKCFQQIIPVTSDIGAVINEAAQLQQLFTGTGLPPEASLSAMAYAAGKGAGFSKPVDYDNIIRVLVTITDNPSKEGTLESHAKNPGTVMPCPKTDPYPLASEVGQVLKDARVYPLILVLKDAMGWWEDKLAGDMNITKENFMVREFSFDMSAGEITKGLVDALVDFTCSDPTMPPINGTTTTTAKFTTTTAKATTSPAPTTVPSTTTESGEPSVECCYLCSRM